MLIDRIAAFIVIAAMFGATPTAAAPPASSTPTPTGPQPARSDDAGRLRAVELRVRAFDRGARQALQAGDSVRACALLLAAERRLPITSLQARAGRLLQAIELLSRTLEMTPGTGLDLAAVATATEALADDAEALLDGAASLEVEAVERAMAALRARQAALGGPSKAQGPAALPGSTPAARAAHRRRGQRLAAGLGTSLGGLALGLAAGLGTSLAARPAGALSRNIQAEAMNQGLDTGSVCAEVAREASGPSPALASLCGRHEDLQLAATSMWVTTGVFAVTTAVFAVLLAEHRRKRSPTLASRHTGGRRLRAVLMPAASGLRIVF